MYVPIAGEKALIVAKVMPGFQPVLDLIFKPLYKLYHDRLPSEMAHHISNVSYLGTYPHHPKGPVLTLATKKLSIILRVSKPFALSDERPISPRPGKF